MTTLTRFYPGEEWKEINFPDKLKLHYAISNHGRIMSFVDKIENGRILKQRVTKGYKLFAYKIFRDGKVFSNKHFFIRKLVAQYFLPPPAPDQIFVLLIDRNRSNNRADNLKWATQKEMINHFKTSPHFIKARLAKKRSSWGQKLTATQVQYIKQKIFDPNRKTRLKMIAKQFGVTTMTLERIRTGENWGHIAVTVNGQTMTKKEKQKPK